MAVNVDGKRSEATRGFRVGILDGIVNSRLSPTILTQASYLTAAATGADSFWVGDHLNALVAMPICTGNSNARWAATAASTADLGDENAARIASASASHRRVEPSTSVNRNFTTAEGAAAGEADTPAESHTDTLLPRTSPESCLGHQPPEAGVAPYPQAGSQRR